MATTATVPAKKSKKLKPSVSSLDGKPSQNQSVAQSDNLALILASLQTMRDGDFSVRLPVAWVGLEGKIADIFNEIVAANEQMAAELNRVGQAVGKEGKTRERTRFQQSRGSWGKMEVSVNTLVEDLLRPKRKSLGRSQPSRREIWPRQCVWMSLEDLLKANSCALPTSS